MAILNIIRSDSRAGCKLRARLRRRGEGLLDQRFLGRTSKVVEAVRAGGDRTLLKAVRRYGAAPPAAIEDLRLDPGAVGDEGLPAGFEAALERAIAAVERYRREQLHPGYRLEENSPAVGGIELVERRSPLQRVGIYVPGGRASLRRRRRRSIAGGGGPPRPGGA